LNQGKTDLTNLTNSIKIFKKQSIESTIQPIELALIVRLGNFTFFKSFPKPPSLKQMIETTNQQVVFHLL